MPLQPVPKENKNWDMKMFKNLGENETLKNWTCGTGPFASPSRCRFYTSRVVALQGRGNAYMLKDAPTRNKYMARDNACERNDYDSPDVNEAVCVQASQQLEDYLEMIRKQGEAKTNADAQEIARRSAGLRPGDPKPDWFREPVAVGFDMLFSPEAKALALQRLGRKNEVLRANVEHEKVRLQNAKASVDIGPGVGKVCGGDFHHDDGCCCRSDIQCGGDPLKFVWQDGHWRCWGGDSIGKLNAEWAGGNRLPCPPGYPDRIDGLCYKACPSSHPLHIKGMPYLCARSADTDGAIRDQFNYDNYDKDDAEHAIKCAEAVVNKNQAGIEEHCGYDARAKAKAGWEDFATKFLSVATAGMWDIYNAVYNAVETDDDKKVNMNTQIFGHPNRGGAVYDKEGNYIRGDKGAGDLHIDGVIDAFLRTKDIATEEACVRAIDDKNLANYLKYCPLFEEVQPTVLDASGNPEIRAILPPELPRLKTDASGNLTDPYWNINQAILPPWDVPEVPVFNEDLLPPIPPDLLEDLPEWMFPRPDLPDMVPPAWPDDILSNPQNPQRTADVLKPTKYNILDHPETLIAGGAFLLALLSIA
jgi:hypothetical protein